MYRQYEDKNFSAASLTIIKQANEIIGEYQEAGFTLTLRQLYYQFVARDIIPNTIKSYKRIGNIVNDARMAGLISWLAIEDRTRNLKKLPHWDSPRSIMGAVINQYRIDKWANQEYRPEVWIEKEALVGVIADICDSFEVPYFACRGYNSQSEQWAAGQRFAEYAREGQCPIVFHLGDHDPSGIDMTRDNSDRLGLFAGTKVIVKRLALNMDQVEEYGPPPNPAKTEDTRYQDYVSSYGEDSWELDALDPQIIVGLIKNAILGVLDQSKWSHMRMKEEKHKDLLVDAMEGMPL